MATLSPMMQQYMQIKQQNPDALLFFRVGDFYEMFFEDALTASRELELTLTGKDCGLAERAPMCGVPFHAVDTYISRLVEKGYRVAVCEQLTDPALSKGLVERDIIRIVTPGTLTDANAIGERKNNYLLSACISGRRIGLSYCDITTGEMYVRVIQHNERELRGALAMVAPSEIISNSPADIAPCTAIACTPFKASAFQAQNARDTLLAHFSVGSLTALGLDATLSPAAAAAGALMAYLNETQKNALAHITRIRIVDKADIMPLDMNTRRNLELTESLRGRSSKGSLLGLMDKTVTAMGGRMLRTWIEQPLLQKDSISARLDAVEALYNEHVLSEALREILGKVYDMERLLSKISYQTLSPRDCLALLRSLEQAPEVLSLMEGVHGGALEGVRSLIDPIPELKALLESAMDENAPVSAADGGVIRQGYNGELDRLRAASVEGKQWLLNLEAREREETGIKNLRIQYNRVFGYYIEVTKANYALVPMRYQRRQTLSNAERFTTDELRSLEAKITGAQEQSQKLEYALFDAVRAEIAKHMERLQRTASGYKTLDALLSLARVARENGYVRPQINEEGVLHIAEGRHPVVEQNLTDAAFVPNDTAMDENEYRMQIITGPNMAGKSTYMRQVALIVLMAHMGSFVPAREANIPLVDCVYTRVGASDDLAAGQSTFMVEMSEMAYILRNATSRSLVILDEIGRGTSTFDGLAIAWAAVEFLCDRKKCGAKTLFATHYHELSELEGHLDGVHNFCVSVKEHGEDVIFLRKIVPGGADKSFGVYVARLAGVPRAVVARAQEIQARLAVNDVTQNSIGQNILSPVNKNRKSEQETLLGYSKTEFIQEIQGLDVLAMTPMDALNTLFMLREKALKL